MQSVSSRIWTRIAVFISYGDNDYTTGTSVDDSGENTFVPRREGVEFMSPPFV